VHFGKRVAGLNEKNLPNINGLIVRSLDRGLKRENHTEGTGKNHRIKLRNRLGYSRERPSKERKLEITRATKE